MAAVLSAAQDTIFPRRRQRISYRQLGIPAIRITPEAAAPSVDGNGGGRLWVLTGRRRGHRDSDNRGAVGAAAILRARGDQLDTGACGEWVPRAFHRGEYRRVNGLAGPLHGLPAVDGGDGGRAFPEGKVRPSRGAPLLVPQGQR